MTTITPEQEQNHVLSEIKTCMKLINALGGNCIGPSLNGQEMTLTDRLSHFLKRATSEFGMSLEEINEATR